MNLRMTIPEFRFDKYIHFLHEGGSHNNAPFHSTPRYDNESIEEDIVPLDTKAIDEPENLFNNIAPNVITTNFLTNEGEVANRDGLDAPY